MPLYLEIHLSMVHDFQVEVDGQAVPRENIRFSPDVEIYFILEELQTVTTYKWSTDKKVLFL
ncbi:C-glycoside deglycosidase beta subunit domain-containing protein [Paenibacillus wynnii]|uniref:C-glycoside deglycosidase beta subunit domain-containing protein n=1 Tax=Paenibacillus wynnii TaxID=268407 RepID=UPI003B839371